MSQAWGFKKTAVQAVRWTSISVGIRQDRNKVGPDGRNTCSVVKLALHIEKQGFSGQALHLQGLADGLG